MYVYYIQLIYPLLRGSSVFVFVLYIPVVRYTRTRSEKATFLFKCRQMEENLFFHSRYNICAYMVRVIDLFGD